MRDRCSFFACSVALLGCVEPTQNNLGGDESTGGAPTGSGASLSSTSDGTGGQTDSVGQTDSLSDSASVGDTEPASESGSSGGGPVCGNGVVEADEVCDDGINDGSYGGCVADCSALGPHCGDGNVQRSAGEACDDGDGENGNGCNVDCVVSGTVLWTEMYSTDIGTSNDHASDVDVGDDGTILVVGRVRGPGASAHAGVILFYDAEGMLVDERTPTQA